ncbi:MAG: CoA pyrophosphatase [Gemmatimonadaceae bacterium]|nr:CoA pyrophosphatase [Gemmatimonadaceae bacterium]
MTADRIARIGAAVHALSPAQAARDEPFWEAAVALVLRPAVSGADLLFIQRAVEERDPWSGQIGLPGGRRNPGEPDLFDTMLRETHEETGIDLATQGEIFGPLDELRPRTPSLPPFIVRPYVARLNTTPELVTSKEVAGYFWAPLDAIFDPANTRPAQVRGRGVTMWNEAIHYDGRVIWGLTERIVRMLQGLAG